MHTETEPTALDPEREQTPYWINEPVSQHLFLWLFAQWDKVYWLSSKAEDTCAHAHACIHLQMYLVRQSEQIHFLFPIIFQCKIFYMCGGHVCICIEALILLGACEWFLLSMLICVTCWKNQHQTQTKSHVLLFLGMTGSCGTISIVYCLPAVHRETKRYVTNNVVLHSDWSIAVTSLSLPVAINSGAPCFLFFWSQ